MPVGVELSDVLDEMLAVEVRKADTDAVDDATDVPVRLGLGLPDAEDDSDPLEELDAVEDREDVFVAAAVLVAVRAELPVRVPVAVGVTTDELVELKVDVEEETAVPLGDCDIADEEVGVETGVPDELPVWLAVMDGVEDRGAHSEPTLKSTPHTSGSSNVKRYVQSNWVPTSVLVVSSLMSLMCTSPSGEHANVMCAWRCALCKQFLRSP